MGGPEFFGAVKGGTSFFSVCQRGGPEFFEGQRGGDQNFFSIFIAPNSFLNALSKKCSHLRRNLSLYCPLHHLCKGNVL